MPWMKKYGRTWSMRAARKASMTTMQQRAAAVHSFAACGSIGKNCSDAYMTASVSSIVLII